MREMPYQVSAAAAAATQGALFAPLDDGGRDPSLAPVYSALDRKKNVVLYGPPGTGKTRAAFALADEWVKENGHGSVLRTTFHPSYSYEDFVQGFRPKTTAPDTFELQQGVLLEASERAKRLAHRAAPGVTPGKVLLVIDEINRADVARVFGELITFIEADKRGPDNAFTFSQVPSKTDYVPENLYVLGTMNTADKSVSLLDLALRRRFAFISYDPDPGVYAAAPDWLEEVDGLPLGELLTTLNEHIRQRGVEPDRSIGHAMLGINKDHGDPKAALRALIADDVVPLVQEYFYMDREQIRAALGEALVDPDGRFNRELSPDDVLNALKALTGLAPATPGEDPGDGLGGDGDDELEGEIDDPAGDAAAGLVDEPALEADEVGEG